MKKAFRAGGAQCTELPREARYTTSDVDGRGVACHPHQQSDPRTRRQRTATDVLAAMPLLLRLAVLLPSMGVQTLYRSSPVYFSTFEPIDLTPYISELECPFVLGGHWTTACAAPECLISIDEAESNGKGKCQ
jgi:hypothetical protein